MLQCDGGKCIAQCGDSWFSIGTSCYYFSINLTQSYSNIMSYSSAQKLCKKHGNNVKVIEIKSAESNEKLQMLIDNNGFGNRYFWIGINKEGHTESSWEYYSDKSLVDYFAWANQTSTLNANNTCAAVKSANGKSEWYSFECSSTNISFICEKGCTKATGDGVCNDENNVADCDFDGGDCCGRGVDTSLCNKCECKDDGDVLCYGQGNGICQDDINIDACSWDGGDCCGMEVNTKSCSNCTCLDPISGNFILSVNLNCYCTYLYFSCYSYFYFFLSAYCFLSFQISLFGVS